MKNLQSNIAAIPQNISLITGKAKELGFKKVLKGIFDDFFANRSLGAWLYLLVLASVPIILEFTSGNEHDYLGLTSSLTGILCVILVAEGRASNFLFGLISNIIYFYLSLSNLFYGEVMIAVFYIIMQPIGVYAWLTARVKNTETSEFVARKETFMDYVKYFALIFVAWLGMGFFFQGIGSARPFRDALTNGLSVGGQIGQTQRFANLSWLLWVLTNVFSIYLWWGTNIHIQGMYWVYLLNSIVGWYNWVKSAK